MENPPLMVVSRHTGREIEFSPVPRLSTLAAGRVPISEIFHLGRHYTQRMNSILEDYYHLFLHVSENWADRSPHICALRLPENEKGQECWCACSRRNLIRCSCECMSYVGYIIYCAERHENYRYNPQHGLWDILLNECHYYGIPRPPLRMIRILEFGDVFIEELH